MFPLHDTVRSRSFPVFNYGLIALNGMIFFVEASLEPRSFKNLLTNLG